MLGAIVLAGTFSKVAEVRTVFGLQQKPSTIEVGW